MTEEQPFVLVNTSKGKRIIKVVEPDKVNMDRYHWTREQLEADYEQVAYHNDKPQFPYYELKNG